MPFLDHLEELRARLLKSIGALILGFGVGVWLVQQLDLLTRLKAPIAPYLPDGKLTVLSPTEPIMIVLKLGLAVGLVLASPVLIYQIWAFLSPALYQRERKAVIPALIVGTVLFLVGAVLGYVVVVPQALRVLLSIEVDAIQTLITYDKYFGFVLQISLALGLSFELPLVIVLLAWLGVVTPARLSRFRRFAVLLALVAGAILSPGADVFSMLLMTAPLIVLYEVGYVGAVVIHRRRLRRTVASAVVLLLVAAGTLSAQGRQRPDTAARTGQPIDTATARRVGLPTGPTQRFAAPDSIVNLLLRRPGYDVTRYRADTATVEVQDRRMELVGNAMTERRGSILEAASIDYREDDCRLEAEGDPRAFEGGTVLIGDVIRYNTCERRAVVLGALTNFQEAGAAWFLRGNVSQDSSSSRIYAGSSEITSCDLPEPHYHFAAREVKWISKNVLVARPAVLYVRDVPILWLPFIFQDARPGRRSGILIPQFGLNDIVRPTRTYNRQVTNVGYYWAPSDYFDVTARLDWYANRYTQVGLGVQYRWLDRFLNGDIAFNRQQETAGSRSTGIRWNHRQSFNLATSLNLSLNYASNSRIVGRNAVDPLLSTQQITSSANFSKRYRWGTLTLGGNRRQSLSDNSATTQFPALTVSPKPLDLGSDITWSPGLSFTNDLASRTPLPSLLLARADGGVDTLAQTGDSRTTAFTFNTPIRIGSFNWRNAIRVTDREATGRQSVETVRIADTTTADPTDSLSVSRYFNGDFSTGVDWDTGINLPVLFRSTWRVQPVLGIANATTAGPFALRNRRTNGDWVTQGKRFSLAVNASPTLFGFLGGVGPVARFRHGVSPILAFNYAPAASVPETYARAVTPVGRPLQLRSDPVMTLSLGLSQNFEAKLKPRTAADTAGQTPAADAPARKIRLLGITTSSLAYDFEQAKKPGRTGWTTQSISNALQSDLLPGFSLNITHDLWDGPVGFDTTGFDPFLQSVSASFAVSGATFRSLLSAVGLRKEDETPPRRGEAPPPSYIAESGRGARPGQGSFFSTEQVPTGLGRRFTANFNLSVSRTRPVPGSETPTPDRSNLGFSTSFSPSALWSVSWSSQYNITDDKFESHVVRLERDLHDWRASFNFVRNANGNFAFFFSVFLVSLPTVKFDYDQTTIDR